jgi:D-glycero-alpha-D-manno-heptose 1-phosphate guanylyltransferase
MLYMHKQPDAIVLCGGAGLRLRSVIGDSAKGMAEIGGRPFLELLFRQLLRHGFRRAILAVGYQRDTIRSFFGDQIDGLELIYSEEASPLGTAGALRKALNLVESDSVLITNGDSYADVDLTEFTQQHRDSKADVSVVVVPADGRSDCGFVLVAPNRHVQGFNEKQAPSDASFINAGIYMVSKATLQEIPSGRPVSLEKESFPRWVSEDKRIQAFVYSGECIDIGTPDRYRVAQQVLAEVEAAVAAQGEGQL